ncbi:hypothetical protein AB4Y89_24465, partial [Terriglobus sp. 2YAB30_2]|uniref:hypothetical protein n=1 Tax=Terriglobus sp. 2YAB30_2 TaxID=3233023 RepID=UPI003F993C2E
ASSERKSWSGVVTTSFGGGPPFTAEPHGTNGNFDERQWGNSASAVSVGPSMVVRAIEVAGQEDVQPDANPGVVVAVQYDLVEDVVVLAHGQQFRPVGQIVKPRPHNSRFRSEFVQGFAAVYFDIVDVVPVNPAQILGDAIHLVHRGPHSSGLALDFHNRQTGTMSP